MSECSDRSDTRKSVGWGLAELLAQALLGLRVLALAVVQALAFAVARAVAVPNQHLGNRYTRMLVQD